MNKHSLYILISDSLVAYIIKIVVLISAFVLYLIFIIPQYSDSYVGALADKVDRLKSIDSPKIVLIGNSNVAYGFDSEYIQSEMGMPVVNMGFHGGVGNKFHDDMMDYNVTPGDIYVICHMTYYYGETIDNPVLAWTAIENNWNLWHLVNKENLYQMVESFPAYIKVSTNRYNTFSDRTEKDDTYNRKSFNEFGDIDVERVYNGADFTEDIWLPVVLSTETDRLNEWNKYMEEHGAKMVVAGFPVVYDQWPSSDEEMDDYQERLESALECRVISYWKDYAYDSNLFFDSPNHLNSEGAKLRSVQLVKDLKKWMEKYQNYED